MRKKNVYEVEMCDDQLRFFLFLVLLSRRPKSWIFSSSPIFDKSQISLFSWVLVLDLHRLHGCREERCPCSSSNVVAKKNLWSGRRISRRAIHNYFLFFFFFINGSSKESKPSEAHPRIFFLSHSSSSDDARQSYWIVLLWTFSSSFHRAKVLAAISIT